MDNKDDGKIYNMYYTNVEQNDFVDTHTAQHVKVGVGGGEGGGEGGWLIEAGTGGAEGEGSGVFLPPPPQKQQPSAISAWAQ